MAIKNRANSGYRMYGLQIKLCLDGKVNISETPYFS